MPGISVIFEDDDLIALNKPSGLLTIPDRFDPTIPSLKKELSEKYKELFVIHRLDRDTSGIILFAKNAAAHKFYSQTFEDRKVTKKYLALVQGTMPAAEGTFDQPLAEHPNIRGKMMVWRKGKHAITHYSVTDQFRGYSWLTIHIETGRTHQIRVHLQNAGHPVVCDALYGTDTPLFLSSIKKNFNLAKSSDEELPLLKRLGLHAHQLGFTNMKGEAMLLEAPLPKDMLATVKQLRKWAGKK
jgi:23S rRNA pseudouridine1911/1915/1917 synthase